MSIKDKLLHAYAVRLIVRSEYFDAERYRQLHPDDQVAWAHPAAHYLDGGWQTCDPSERFSNAAYLVANTNVEAAGLCPLYHYERYGRREKRAISLSQPMTAGSPGRYRRFGLLRKAVRALGRRRYQAEIAANAQSRILVCLQLYYPESWPEIYDYLQNLAPYCFELRVSYPALLEATAERIRIEYPSCVLECADNRGFDVGAFHKQLQSVELSRYDIVIKIHSKGTARKRCLVGGELCQKRDWFLYLYEGVLGGWNVHRMIDLLMHQPDCGLIAACNLLIEDEALSCKMLRKRLTREPDLPPVPEQYRFAAGSCYAQKATLLVPFQQLQPDFEPTQQNVYSMAHCLERVCSVLVTEQGASLVGLPVCRFRQAVRKVQLRIRRLLAAKQPSDDQNIGG